VKGKSLLLLTLAYCAVQAQGPSIVDHSARHWTTTPQVAPSVSEALTAESLACRLVGRLPNPDGTHFGYGNLDVKGDIVYLPAVNGKLYTVSIKNPTSPIVVGEYSDAGLDIDPVVVEGDYAYVAGSIYFRVLDIGDSSDLTLVGDCYLSGPAAGITKVGNYAYVCAWSGGLDVIEVSDPENPTLVGNCPSYGARTVAVVGNYAYVANAAQDSLDMVRVIDVSDPSNPTEVGHIDTYCSEGIHPVDATHVFVADGTTMPMLDISTPASPSVVGLYDPASYTYSVDVSGTRAYAASDWGGLLVLDISNATAPQQIGYWRSTGDTVSGALAVAKLDSYCYVIDWYAGLQVLQFYGDVGVEEGGLPPAYSPRSTATIVRGVLFLTGDGRPGTGERVALLDASGRRVMELQPGPNDVQHLSPGVYFVSRPKSVEKVLLTR
jgi:hypothetical protein